MPFEVLVVNNNCSDDTDAVIRRYTGALPIRRIAEPLPGLSHARNAAVREAKGTFVLWTDDDILVDRNWLCAYEEALLRNPRASILGGPIIPKFEGEIPRWLERHWKKIGSVFGFIDLGADAVPFAADRLPLGANFAMSTDLLRAIQFDGKLGRKQGGLMLHGEETIAMRTAIENGANGVWVPSAIVHHRIPPSRRTAKYVYRYFVGYGFTNAAISREFPSGKQFLGIPRWTLRLVVSEHLQFLAGLARPGSGQWIEHFWRAGYWAGHALYARQLHRTKLNRG
jgi:glycosyltransferase involved in cell wall biosynthesis